MTNPNDIIRTRARTGGRASVYEANAWAQMLSTGLLDGSGVTQNTSADMNVLVGGSSTNPDVLIAENPSGYKIALDVVGQQAVTITAPTSNSRISSIVAYTDDLALSTTQDDITGSPASCGLIVVNGAASSSPVAPDDETIRTAITADGATGSQASYVVIANITIASTTTAITNSLISINKAGVTSHKIDFTTFNGNIGTAAIADGAVTSAKIANNAVTATKFDWSTFQSYTSTSANALTTSTSYQNTNASVTCAAGKYILIGICTFNHSSGSGTGINLRIANGSNTTVGTEQTGWFSGGRASMSVMAYVTPSSSMTYRLSAKKGESNPVVQCYDANLVAIRVG